MAWIVLAVTALVVLWIARRRADPRPPNAQGETPERIEFYDSHNPPA